MGSSEIPRSFGESDDAAELFDFEADLLSSENMSELFAFADVAQQVRRLRQLSRAPHLLFSVQGDTQRFTLLTAQPIGSSTHERGERIIVNEYGYDTTVGDRVVLVDDYVVNFDRYQIAHRRTVIRRDPAGGPDESWVLDDHIGPRISKKGNYVNVYRNGFYESSFLSEPTFTDDTELAHSLATLIQPLGMGALDEYVEIRFN